MEVVVCRNNRRQEYGDLLRPLLGFDSLVQGSD